MTPLPPRMCTQTVAERVGLALDLVPPRIAERVGPLPFFEGDAVFSGFSRDHGEYRYERHGEQLVGLHREMASCFYRLERNGRFSSAVHVPWAGAGYGGTGLVSATLHEVGHALWNAIVRSHMRWRVFWDPGEREVLRRESSGLVPSMMPFTSYQPRDMGEQFAEAFRIWLSPRHLLEAYWEPERFYTASRGWTVDHRGERTDNRRVLAWLNELAGWPGDRAPRAFLDESVL